MNQFDSPEDQQESGPTEDGLERPAMSTRYGCMIIFVGVGLMVFLSAFGKQLCRLTMGN